MKRNTRIAVLEGGGTVGHLWVAIEKKDGRVIQELYPGFGKVREVFWTRILRNILDLGCGDGRHGVARASQGMYSPEVHYSVRGERSEPRIQPAERGQGARGWLVKMAELGSTCAETLCASG